MYFVSYLFQVTTIASEKGCTFEFGETSAATPVVSAAAALVLETKWAQLGGWITSVSKYFLN